MRMLMTKLIHRRWLSRQRRHVIVGLTAFFVLLPEVHAVFLFTPLGSPRRIILTVGSTNTTVNTVNFNVVNTNVAPTPVAVAGTTGNGAPSTSPANGVEITMDTRFTNNQGNTVSLTVDSSAGLSCNAGSGCGSTSISFNNISWTSYNQDTTYPGYDIQNGTFDGTSTQQLSRVTVTGGSNSGASVTMKNILVFQYNNTTLYPAGSYSGRVVFTASIL